MVTARNRRPVATAATRPWFVAEAIGMSCGTPESEQEAGEEMEWYGVVAVRCRSVTR
jgi:hypothetical protein